MGVNEGDAEADPSKYQPGQAAGNEGGGQDPENRQQGDGGDRLGQFIELDMDRSGEQQEPKHAMEHGLVEVDQRHHECGLFAEAACMRTDQDQSQQRDQPDQHAQLMKLATAAREMKMLTRPKSVTGTPSDGQVSRGRKKRERPDRARQMGLLFRRPVHNVMLL